MGVLDVFLEDLLLLLLDFFVLVLFLLLRLVVLSDERLVAAVSPEAKLQLELDLVNCLDRGLLLVLLSDLVVLLSMDLDLVLPALGMEGGGGNSGCSSWVDVAEREMDVRLNNMVNR